MNSRLSSTSFMNVEWASAKYSRTMKQSHLLDETHEFQRCKLYERLSSQQLSERRVNIPSSLEPTLVPAYGCWRRPSEELAFLSAMNHKVKLGQSLLGVAIWLLWCASRAARSQQRPVVFAAPPPGRRPTKYPAISPAIISHSASSRVDKFHRISTRSLKTIFLTGSDQKKILRESRPSIVVRGGIDLVKCNRNVLRLHPIFGLSQVHQISTTYNPTWWKTALLSWTGLRRSDFEGKNAHERATTWDLGAEYFLFFFITRRVTKALIRFPGICRGFTNSEELIPFGLGFLELENNGAEGITMALVLIKQIRLGRQVEILCHLSFRAQLVTQKSNEDRKMIDTGKWGKIKETIGT